MRNGEQPPQKYRPFPRYRPTSRRPSKVGGAAVQEHRTRRAPTGSTPRSGRARPATPYQVAITPKGAQLSYGFKRRRATSEAQLDPFGVDWFVSPFQMVGTRRRSLLMPPRGSRKWRPRRAVFVASGDALYGYSNRTQNATLERRSALGRRRTTVGWGWCCARALHS